MYYVAMLARWSAPCASLLHTDGGRSKWPNKGSICLHGGRITSFSHQKPLPCPDNEFMPQGIRLNRVPYLLVLSLMTPTRALETRLAKASGGAAALIVPESVKGSDLEKGLVYDPANKLSG